MGKGGSNTTEVKVPKYVEDAAKANLAKADLLAQIGYVPEYGPSTAAFSPMQEDAFRNINSAASAFGLSSGGTGLEGIPEATTYAGGVRGYSSAPLFEESMAQLEAKRPGQYAAINAPFIDPVTGASPGYPYAGSTGQQPVVDGNVDGNAGGNVGGNVGGSNDGGGNPLMNETYARAKASRDDAPNTGYTGFGDMFDGGGPGMSGDTYQGGGLLSSFGNFIGGKS